MKIESYQVIFLGTAGGSEAVTSQVRSSGGIILKLGEAQCHLDPGPGTLLMARDLKINLKENDVILLSHNHLSHTNDVNMLISLLTENGTIQKGILLGSKSSIDGDEKNTPVLKQFYLDSMKRHLVLEPGNNVKLSNLNIKALKTKHSDEDCLGFKFFSEKFVLSYSSDTEFFPEIVDEMRGSDILILNNLKSFNEPKGNNLRSSDSLKIINEVKPKLAILTHFGKKILEKNPIYDAREIQKKTNIQTIAALDGMIINPLSYSVTLRHRTLNLY